MSRAAIRLIIGALVALPAILLAHGLLRHVAAVVGAALGVA